MSGGIQFRRVLEIVLLICCWTQVAVGSPEEKILTALYVPSPIVVDGNLDEAEWSLAQPAADFTQTEPGNGEPVTERTEVRLLYDDENLYIGVYCFDSTGPEGIVVNDVTRDYFPMQGDHFGVILDTFDKNVMALCLALTPLEAGEKVKRREMERTSTLIGTLFGR